MDKLIIFLLGLSAGMTVSLCIVHLGEVLRLKFSKRK